MTIPETIKLPENGLPENPGVYLMRDETGKVIYVGKASNLRRRVSSYWRPREALARPQVRDLIREARRIDVIETPTVIEALILEANKIKEFDPKYNILQKDDKSFLYLAITKDEFPRPLLVRGHDLEHEGRSRYKAVFGPYLNAASLRAALKIIRRIFPWSTCLPGQKRACFEHHLKMCPGVCIGAISRRDYAKVIRNVILFFEGRKGDLLKKLRREMKAYSKAECYEEAAIARGQIFALEHIQDVAVLTREENELFGHPRRGELVVNVFGRIEGYDISNISGTSAVGSLVVFKDGEPSKKDYRKFRIKTVEGANDYATLEEVLRRRFARAASEGGEQWELPKLILIDGGLGQVNVTRKVLFEKKLEIPVIGIAKGFDRKQDQLVFDRTNLDLARVAAQYKEVLQRLRDEAHRFAIGYHRKLRSKRR